jgi:hypothetical protein
VVRFAEAEAARHDGRETSAQDRVSVKPLCQRGRGGAANVSTSGWSPSWSPKGHW